MSSIEWTERTWNPVSGCTRVSAGCDNCYAVAMTHRLERMGQVKKYGGLTVLNGKGDRHFNGVVRCHEDALDIPLKRKKSTTWFVNSMSDLFHKDVPFEFIDKVLAVAALCPQHIFQILTKRPERMAEYFGRTVDLEQVAETIRTPPTVQRDGRPVGTFSHAAWGHYQGWPLPNGWLGTSIESPDQLHRSMRLRDCPAAVRFLSLEPLLAGIVFEHRHLEHIHWVIIGGESGPKARPCNIEWIRSIVEQCKAAGVPVFVKQLGKWPVCREAQGVGPEVIRDQSIIDGEWPRGTQFGNPTGEQSLNGRVAYLQSTKGGDPSEWPEGFPREFPAKESTP